MNNNRVKGLYFSLFILLVVTSCMPALVTREAPTVENEFYIEFESEIVPDPCRIPGFLCEISPEKEPQKRLR